MNTSYRFNQVNIDRCELNVVTTTERIHQHNELLNLPLYGMAPIPLEPLIDVGFDSDDLDAVINANGEELNLRKGPPFGKGNSFSPYTLACPGLFQLFPRVRGPHQVKAELYAPWFLLQKYPLTNFRILMKIVCGYVWRDDQISRLDLYHDMPIPFAEVAEKIDQRCYVCRGLLDESKLDDCPTARYFGKQDRLQANTYDKTLELRETRKTTPLSASLSQHQLDLLGGESCTRLEFRLGRRTLSQRGIESLKDLYQFGLPVMWRYLTCNWLRLTESPNTDVVKSNRLTDWATWKPVQSAKISSYLRRDLRLASLPSDTALIR